MGADLECAFLNTYQARWQLIADALGTAFAQGKTMFWRRDYLDEGGSIEALASEPAEDAASTKLIRAAGRKVRLVVRPFPQPLGTRAVADVWRRQVRWARLRRSSFPLVYAPEAVSGGFFPILGAAVLVAMGALPIGWFIGLVVAWYAAELALAQRYDWPVSPRILGLIVVRDLLLFPLWIVGWTGKHVRVARQRHGHQDRGDARATACRAVDDLSHGTFGRGACHRQAHHGQHGAGQWRAAGRMMEKPE